MNKLLLAAFIALLFALPASAGLKAVAASGGGGSGTVTDVGCGTGLNGGTITTTGVCSANFGTASNTIAQGNDTRFPASVTGLRKGAGAGSADTAAVAGTDYVIPSGNVATATALAATPTACGSNTFATSIAANGNLTCTSLAAYAAAISGTNYTITANGAASLPAFLATGTPYTGGTGTTNYPLVYLNCTGSTQPTNLPAAGSWLGINACSGFTGSFIEFRVNGSSTYFNIDSSGNISTSGSVKAGTFTSTSVVCNNTAPTVASAGTSPTFPAVNGTCAFDLNVGTGTIPTTASVTMPTAASHHWSCHATDGTNPTTIRVEAVGSSTTNLNLYFLSQTTGSATAPSASDVIQIQCTGV